MDFLRRIVKGSWKCNWFVCEKIERRVEESEKQLQEGLINGPKFSPHRTYCFIGKTRLESGENAAPLVIKMRSRLKITHVEVEIGNSCY